VNQFGVYLQWRSQIEEMLDPVYYPIAWLDARVTAGDVLLFHEPEAAAIMEIRTYPSGARDLHALLAVGDLDVIRSKLIPSVEQAGRSLGCEAVLISSRTGWMRALREQGYEPHQVCIRKAL
jgi:hypothetical protein